MVFHDLLSVIYKGLSHFFPRLLYRFFSQHCHVIKCSWQKWCWSTIRIFATKAAHILNIQISYKFISWRDGDHCPAIFVLFYCRLTHISSILLWENLTGHIQNTFFIYIIFIFLYRWWYAVNYFYKRITKENTWSNKTIFVSDWSNNKETLYQTD